ncbi:MAG: hypothetical protein GX242_01770 [Clostridiales bacterium]|nr:hypothetical protein [Clostridiales bacterium]
MKIFRFKERRFEHLHASGKTMAQLQDYFLGKNIIEIEDESQISVDSQEYYAVIYNDTPLITRPFLASLAEECEALSTFYKLGDGYIMRKGADFTTKVCDHPLAFQVKKYVDIVKVGENIRWYILDKHLKNDITIYDPTTTYIDLEVEIEQGAQIYPMVMLRGKTKIGKNAIVFPNCELIDTIVGENVDIRATFAMDSSIGKNSTVGPFACLRKGAKIGAYCRIGDFVEVKNSVIADGVKMAHLAYVGDSDVGENTNIGCGTVFANYNGKNKSRCTVGSNVFIGANTNLIAPVTVNSGAYIAAGSTITKDVPAGNLCIARSRQVFKENWERK